MITDIVLDFECEFNGKKYGLTKVIKESDAKESFLLGLAIDSYIKNIRDNLIKELQNNGYELDMLD